MSDVPRSLQSWVFNHSIGRTHSWCFSTFYKNCIYRMRASGAYRDFSREAVNVFRRFVRHRARWLGWHRAGPRAVNMRAVDAATFTSNVVIESFFFFFPRRYVPILYNTSKYLVHVIVLRTAFYKKVEKRQLWVRPTEWVKLNFASCVVHQTRWLDVLILYFICNMFFVN